MMEKIYLTRKGREKLIKELEELQKRKPLIQDEISKAREYGDLKENSEYHAAKETLSSLMRRIIELESKITCAKIIDEKSIDTDRVFIGVTIIIQDENYNDYEYTVVDLEEADIGTNKISVQSPLVQGLLGHKEGEICEVKLPSGKTKFKILKIFIK
ncbi:MAG: transcription elongation factor GreA [Endomicrobium sp.]|jgi:transcription elongation factor GreA|nr:transcription elongation factor GreA [Endomicrobium sp.]